MPIAAVRFDRCRRMAYDARHICIIGESLRAGGRDARLMRSPADRRRLDERTVLAASGQARALPDEWLARGCLPASG